MIKIQTCHSCHSPQPVDWKAGDHCNNCGDVVREDVSCAWCTHAVPNQKFCRDCGFEMVEPQLFGVARMLKDSGIDKLSLASRVRDLEPDHVAHYKSLYNRHLAVLDNRIEELRLCEQFLIYKHYSRRLRDSYLAQIPFDEATMAHLKSGAEGPFQGREEKLIEVIERSPIAETKTLGLLASVFANEVNWDGDFIARREREITSLFTRSSNPDLLVECMAAFASGSMVRILMKEKQFPFLKGRFADRTKQFLDQHWHGLGQQARLRIAPFVVRLKDLEQLDPKLQHSIKTSLAQATNNQDEEVQFSAFVANQNGKELYTIIEKDPDAENAELAARIICESQFPNECAKLLRIAHAGLQKLAFTILYESQNNVFRVTHVDPKIAESAVQYLLEDSKQEFQHEALYMISQVPGFKQDVIRILQQVVEKSGSPDILVSALHGSGDEETSQAIIKELLRHDLNEEILKVLCFKSDKVNFGQDMIQKVIDFRLSDQYNLDDHRHLTAPIIQKQLQREDEGAYYMTRSVMNGLFLQHPQQMYEGIRFMWKDDPRQIYIDPLNGQVDKLHIDTAHLHRYFDSPADFARGFAEMLRGLGKDDSQRLMWQFRTFWKPFEEGWKDFVSSERSIQMIVAQGWIDLLHNTDLHEPSRALGVKALANIMPCLSGDKAKMVKDQLQEVPKISSTGSLGREIRTLCEMESV